MHDQPLDAMVPALAKDQEVPPRVRRVRRPLGGWVRLALVAMALGWAAVFGVALGLDPYQGETVWLEETHRQLGLPPCTFKAITDLPCPSCGMTSSFALLIRGDLWHAAQANVVGAGLAIVGIVMAPWCLVSAARARWLWFRRIELIFIRLVVVFLIAMFARWGIVLLWIWWSRT